MSKKKNKSLPHDHGRGEIKDNAMKALVTSTLFRPKVEKSKKGSYQRKSKHGKGREPYQKTTRVVF